MESGKASTVREKAAAEADGSLLEPGDRLSRPEFERRYNRMPRLKKAELIEGTLYMPSPVRVKGHARPHSWLALWLGHYAMETPVVECLDNKTVRLDLDNEPQPDLALIKAPSKGGLTRVSPDDYLEGPPELAVEIVGSSRAYDLHQKKAVCRRHGVGEYLVWVTGENRIIWWRLCEGEYEELKQDREGLFKSPVFPGLWLNAEALLKGDLKEVMNTLCRGLESPGHQAFIAG